jgi:hypothetical protein
VSRWCQTSYVTTYSNAKATLAGRRDFLVHLDVLVVKTRVLAVRHGLDLEGDSGADEGSSHAHEGKKEQGRVPLHCFFFVTELRCHNLARIFDFLVALLQLARE